MAWQKAAVKPDNSLALFKNREKKGERDPDYKGQGKVSGREYWVSGWINESRKDGSKYLSIKLKDKVDVGQRRAREDYEHGDSQKPFHDDEIPF